MRLIEFVNATATFYEKLVICTAIPVVALFISELVIHSLLRIVKDRFRDYVHIALTAIQIIALFYIVFLVTDHIQFVQVVKDIWTYI